MIFEWMRIYENRSQVLPVLLTESSLQVFQGFECENLTENSEKMSLK